MKIKNKIGDNWYILFPAVVILAVAVFRICYTLNSGYLSPDETLYYSSGLISLRQGKTVLRYHTRILFQYFIIGLTYFLNLDNVYKYIVTMSILFSMMTMTNLSLLDRISKYLDIGEEQRRWAIASLGLCVTFVVYSSLVLTEVFSLFFFLIGLFLLLRVIHGESVSVFYSLLSSIFLMIATTERKPYVLFYIANGFILLIYTFRRKLKWHHIVMYGSSGFVVFLLMFGPSLLPLPISPLVSGEEIVQFTKTENVTKKTTSLTYPREPEKMMDLAPIRWGSRTIANTIVSLVLGWNPVCMVVGMIGMFVWMRDIFRGRCDDLLIFANVVAGFGSLLGTWIMISRYPLFTIFSEFPKIGASLGVGIRFAHSTVISYLSIGKANRVIGLKKAFCLTFAVLLVLSPSYFYFVQSNLSTEKINRVSLDYVSPWELLRRYTMNSGKTLVIGEPILRIAIFTVDNPSVSISQPLNEVQFDEEYRKDWDTILIYGENHQLHEMLLERNCPWHIDLIENRTIYRYSVVWRNEESYCYEVER